MLGELVGLDLALLEPEGNFLLGGLDAVGAVADVAADVLDTEVSVLLLACSFWMSRLTMA